MLSRSGPQLLAPSNCQLLENVIAMNLKTIAISKRQWAPNFIEICQKAFHAFYFYQGSGSIQILYEIFATIPSFLKGSANFTAEWVIEDFKVENPEEEEDKNRWTTSKMFILDLIFVNNLIQHVRSKYLLLG